MFINRNAWHYKAIRKLDRYPEQNLCPYVRQVIYACATWVFFAILAIIIGTVLLITLSYPVTQLFFTSIPMVISSVLLYIFIGVVVLKWYRDEGPYYLHRPRANKSWFWRTDWLHIDLFGWLPEREPRPCKPPGLVRSYLRAKHDKICPHLDFVNYTTKEK